MQVEAGRREAASLREEASRSGRELERLARAEGDLKQVAEEKQQQAMALVIMGTVGLEKEKYRLGHTKVLEFVTTATFFCGMMKCKSRGCYGVFLIPSLTLGVLPCWCPWYDGRVQGRAG